VDGPERHAPLHQVAGRHDVFWQGLPQLQAVLLKEVVEDAADRPTREADLLHCLAAGVEGDDAAGVENRALVVQLVEVGVRHREPAAVLLHFAVERHLIALLKGLAHPPDALEPGALHAAALLARQDDLQPLLALARHHVDGLHGAHDGHRIGAFPQLPDRRDGGAVEVAAGVEVEEVAHRAHAIGVGPHVGPLLADALHVAHVLLQKVVTHALGEWTDVRVDVWTMCDHVHASCHTEREGRVPGQPGIGAESAVRPYRRSLIRSISPSRISSHRIRLQDLLCQSAFDLLCVWT